MLDVDGFKLVNDGLGHALRGRAAGAGRRADASPWYAPRTRSRAWARDEFAVLLENVRGLDDALGAAERLRQAFRDAVRG